MSTLDARADPALVAKPRGAILEHATASAAFIVGAGLLWLSSPHHGEFWWSDAPRHALNGVFIRDLFAAFPWRDPAGFAAQYYVHYPALTILFYPPLFYLISAPFFAVFGVSHATALSVVMLHYVALALGLYVLARRWLSFPVALAVGLSVMAAPGVALWGRQVMLEIPAMAFAVWAFVLLRRHADEARAGFLYGGAFLLLCAIYTKFSAIFLVPVAALLLLAARGKAIFQDRHSWIAAGLFAIGFIPVAVLTWKFGQANVVSVTSLPGSEVSRATLSGWLWYLQRLPGQLGWPIAIGAAIGFAAMLRPRGGVTRTDLVMLLGWAAVGYLFFSAIDLKEARHSTLMLPPLLIASGFAVQSFLPPRVAPWVALLVVVGAGSWTWRHAPVPAVSGYREAADWIASNAPHDAIVVFSGKRDGSFIFNLRTHEDRGDLYTIRADKLLLDFAVTRERGVDQRNYSAEQIGALLDAHGAQYVVAQSDFWTDLEVMARLQQVLRSDQFELVATIPVKANIGAEDKELRIYRNKHSAKAGDQVLRLNLPIIGRQIEGRVGGGP